MAVEQNCQFWSTGSLPITTGIQLHDILHLCNITSFMLHKRRLRASGLRRNREFGSRKEHSCGFAISTIHETIQKNLICRKEKQGLDMDLWHLGILLVLSWMAWLKRRVIVYYLRTRHLLNRTLARYILLSSSDVWLSSLIHVGGVVGCLLLSDAYYGWFSKTLE